MFGSAHRAHIGGGLPVAMLFRALLMSFGPHQHDICTYLYPPTMIGVGCCQEATQRHSVLPLFVGQVACSILSQEQRTRGWI